MTYKEFEDSKYPTEQEDKLLHLLHKAGTLNNLILAKKMNLTLEEIKNLLDSLMKKGMIHNCAAPINKQCTRDDWILMECFEPLLELEEKGLIILNIRPGKGAINGMRAWAQENCWDVPTKAEKELKLKVLLMDGHIVRTEKGMRRSEEIEKGNKGTA